MMCDRSYLKFCGLFLAVALTLSACTPIATNPSSSTATNDLLVTALMQTIAAGESSTPTPVTPAPTESPTSTETPSPSPTITATPTPVSLLQSYAAVSEIGCLPQNTEEDLAVVIGIVDGDTIQVIYNGNVHTVTYLGISAPMLDSIDKNMAALAQSAYNENKSLVYGKIVLLVKDSTDADSSGALLRYVLTDSQFVNETLVSQGMAVALAVPPDVACRTVFEKIQQTAMAQYSGIWQPTATSTPRPNNLPSFTPTFMKSDH